MPECKHIIVDRPLEGVARITLNRPDSRNALNNTLRGEIYSTLEAHDRDDEIRVTIIRGAGKAFCAGYDLRATTMSIGLFTRLAATAAGPATWWKALFGSGTLPNP